jgi:uncharacterized membrane protein YgcG
VADKRAECKVDFVAPVHVDGCVGVEAAATAAVLVTAVAMAAKGEGVEVDRGGEESGYVALHTVHYLVKLRRKVVKLFPRVLLSGRSRGGGGGGQGERERERERERQRETERERERHGDTDTDVDTQTSTQNDGSTRLAHTHTSKGRRSTPTDMPANQPRFPVYLARKIVAQHRHVAPPAPAGERDALVRRLTVVSVGHKATLKVCQRSATQRPVALQVTLRDRSQERHVQELATFVVEAAAVRRALVVRRQRCQHFNRSVIAAVAVVEHDVEHAAVVVQQQRGGGGENGTFVFKNAKDGASVPPAVAPKRTNTGAGGNGARVEHGGGGGGGGGERCGGARRVIG